MSINKITDPLIRRIFFVTDSPDRVIDLVIGRPYPGADGVWECPFDIRGIDDQLFADYGKAGYGEDGLDALMLAIDSAKRILKKSKLSLTVVYDRMAKAAQYYADDLDFMKETNGGIPLIFSAWYGKNFEQDVRKHVEQMACTIGTAMLILKDREVVKDVSAQEVLLAMVEQRKFVLPEKYKEAVVACEDRCTLKKWLHRSITVENVEEIFGDQV